MKKKKKVFFWLKLDQNFFKNLAIKHALKRVPGGKDIVLIYQMLMLESLSTEGVLYYEGTLPSLEKELAVKLDVEEEEIQMTIGYFKQAGLIQVDDEHNAEMLQVPALMEQETDWARYKREQRKTLKLDNVQQVSNNCPTELEIELELEQEIDIEKEIKSEVDIVKTATELNIYEYYQQRIGSLDGYQYEKLKDYLDIDRLEPELVKRAIDRAADNAKRNFGYVNAILKNWAQNDIKTIVQQDEEQRNFVDRKSSSFQNGNTSQPRKTNIPDWALEEIEQDNSEEAMQRMQALKAKMLAAEKGEPVPDWAEKVLAGKQTAEGQAKLADIYAELEAMENGET
ncbi:TPA: DnaD domain protein [Streptococcus suis]|uniref:DnaD domain protein n=1 Tax=Streptococcus suis TaxID=1307 RepID=A0AAP6A7Z1_STRSU|nr:DnaD domain protein [Streptococcus suis]MCH1645056.1 DnaD domain protein [Streptococcus suis]MCL4942264.1 DnaD domain protein [Streptococcus suis]MDW8633112.1 DnaD domain protein [Streptococcus suis]MDW8635465.1 DnaD domain protein [Streptococcus suis]HEL9640953.1 DnaD domain protein [Streptococcus suis]